MDALGIVRITLKANRAATAIPELRRYMKNEQKNAEQLIFISCQNFANLVTVLAMPQKRMNLKVILSERLHPAEFLYNGKERKGRVIVSLMKCLYPKADVVLANSKETADEVTRLTGTKVTCIYNPTLTGNYKALAEEPVAQNPAIQNPETQHPATQKLAAQDWFASNLPVIISTGRLAPEKGYDTLLKAFALVQQQIDCRLVIIGEGDQRTELENLAQSLAIADKVWMPGYDANPYKYVSKADVFVLSSRFEGLPNTLIEALAVGTPCVSTRCKSGPSEILLNGEGGFLVDVDDAEKMADAIVTVLQNPEKANAMLQKAQEKLDRFTPEVVGRKYLEVIEA
jgi:glycosyltransferase involved in cell wall biosynthesis